MIVSSTRTSFLSHPDLYSKQDSIIDYVRILLESNWKIFIGNPVTCEMTIVIYVFL